MKICFLIVVMFPFLVSAQKTVENKKSDVLLSRGMYEEAIPLLKEEKRYGKLAKTYQEIGQYSKAKTYYEKALFEKRNAGLAFNYAQVLEKLSFFHEADSVLSQLQSLHPDNPSFIFHRGKVQEKMGDISAAFENYQLAYALDSTNLNIGYKLAQYFIQTNLFDLAKPFVKQGIKANPNSANFTLLWAYIHVNEKEYLKAISTFEKLLEMGRNDRIIYHHLAASYERTRQFNKAIENYLILQQEYPDDSPTVWYHELGRVYTKNHQYEKAEESIQYALEFFADPYLDEYIALAKLYRKQKEYQKAIAVLQKTLSYAPSYESAMYELGKTAAMYYEDKNIAHQYYQKYLDVYGKTGKYSEPIIKWMKKR